MLNTYCCFTKFKWDKFKYFLVSTQPGKSLFDDELIIREKYFQFVVVEEQNDTYCQQSSHPLKRIANPFISYGNLLIIILQNCSLEKYADVWTVKNPFILNLSFV